MTRLTKAGLPVLIPCRGRDLQAYGSLLIPAMKRGSAPGRKQAGPQRFRPPLPALALVPEFLAWLSVLAVPAVLCFTPMVLIVVSITRSLP